MQSLDDNNVTDVECNKLSPLPIRTRLQQIWSNLPSLYRHCLGGSVETMTPDNSTRYTSEAAAGSPVLPIACTASRSATLFQAPLLHAAHTTQGFIQKDALQSEDMTSCRCSTPLDSSLQQHSGDVHLQLAREQQDTCVESEIVLGLVGMRMQSSTLQLEFDILPVGCIPDLSSKHSLLTDESVTGTMRVSPTHHVPLATLDQPDWRPKRTEAGGLSHRVLPSSPGESSPAITDEDPQQLHSDMQTHLSAKERVSKEQLLLLPPSAVSTAATGVMQQKSMLWASLWQHTEPHPMQVSCCSWANTQHGNCTEHGTAGASVNIWPPHSYSHSKAQQQGDAAAVFQFGGVNNPTELLADWKEQDSDEFNLGSPTGRRLVELTPDEDDRRALGNHSTDNHCDVGSQHGPLGLQQLPQLLGTPSLRGGSPTQHGYDATAAAVKPSIDFLEVRKLSVLGPVVDTVMVFECPDAAPPDYSAPQVLCSQYTDEWEQPPKDLEAAACSSWLHPAGTNADVPVHVKLADVLPPAAFTNMLGCLGIGQSADAAVVSNRQSGAGDCVPDV